MKLTFIKKSTGKIVSKDITFAQPISKSVNKAKDLFYFIDLDDKDTTGHYKIKCCKISKIDKNRTNQIILNTIKQY